MWIRWNVSSRARLLSGGDAIVVSIPKSGRTWLRAFLGAYYSARLGKKMALDPERYGDRSVPRVIYTHDLFEHRTKGSSWDRARGKYLVPTAELRRARIILLARDPRDAFVSLFVQLTRRTKETPGELKRKTIGDLLRDPAFGIVSMIDVMNLWLREFSPLPGFSLFRYETLRQAPAENFRTLLTALGETSPQPDAYQHALAFSEFGNMKNLEAAGAFESKILRAGDAHDPESFKVRRGKIGGYQEYLSEEEQSYARTAMRTLDARFGYTP